MNYTEISYSNKDEWHQIRKKYIGGSDASIIMNLNIYKNSQDLWLEKSGLKEADNLEENKAVQRGVKSEDLLVEHFRINNPAYHVYKVEKTLRSKEYDFMIANLDGALYNEEHGTGILEIKTATCHSSNVYFDKWKNDIPIEYYLQIQHYLAVTGYGYAILYADIRLEYTKEKKHEIKKYFIERNDEDIQQIIRKEKEFYQYLLDGKQPPLTKKLIF